MSNPNPNVTILSGETAEPLPKQTGAFPFPADTLRCDVCALPIRQPIIGVDWSFRCKAHKATV